jgi:DNA-binding transcriptional LysR family regulator
VDLRRLRYFVVLARELHFRRAAEILHIAQPALSQQMKVLEREVGVQLLIRSSRAVSLTEAGETLRIEAERLLTDVETAVERTRAVGNGSAGHLRIAHTRSAPDLGTHELVQSYRERHPGVGVSASTGWTAHNISLLRSGRTDVAFVRLPLLNAPDLETMRLGSEEMVVVMSADHRLAVHNRVSRPDLADEPVVTWPRAQGQGYYDAIIDQVWGGQRPNVVAEEPDAEHILTAVASGLGIAILDHKRAQKLKPRDVVIRRFGSPQPRTMFGLAWLVGDPRAVVKNFVAECAGFVSATASSQR